MKLLPFYKRSKFTDERLVQYLLGTGLTTQEREEIEEACFHDDNTFQRAQELELELVEAYKRGQLTEERQKLVSDLVARSAQLQEHARFAEALRRTAIHHTVETAPPLRTKWVRAWLSLWGAWKFASAIATILMVAFFGYSRWSESQILYDAKPDLPERGLRQRVSLGEGEAPTVRGEAEFVDLVIPETPQDCTLSSIKVSNLDRDQAIPRARLQGWYEFVGGTSSHAVISVPGSSLTPGTWSVTVDSKCGNATQTKTAKYTFVR